MKVKVTYKKASDGKILSSIRVIDGEDYPTTFIFSKYDDYPTNDGYTLSTKHQSLIECKLDSTEEATEWVEKQISALKDHLQKWRAIQVQEEATYII